MTLSMSMTHCLLVVNVKSSEQRPFTPVPKTDEGLLIEQVGMASDDIFLALETLNDHTLPIPQFHALQEPSSSLSLLHLQSNCPVDT